MNILSLVREGVMIKFYCPGYLHKFLHVACGKSNLLQNTFTHCTVTSPMNDSGMSIQHYTIYVYTHNPQLTTCPTQKYIHLNK